MKKLTTVILALIILSSCQKENAPNEEDHIKVKTANKIGNPVDQIYHVTLPTVFLSSSHVFEFDWVFNGSTGYQLLNPKTKIIGGSYSATWQQNIVYWTNTPNTTVIYFTIRGREYHMVPVWGHMEDAVSEVLIEGWYNTSNGTFKITPHVVSSTIVP